MELNVALEHGSECGSLSIKEIRHCIRKCQTLIARMRANDQTCLRDLSAVVFFKKHFADISHVYGG